MTPAKATDSPPGTRFYARPAEIVARELLGMRIISSVGGETTIGRIVEVEAYLGPHDDASHAAARIGRTSRNASMFGAPGIAYVYRIYGVHWCLNVVTDAVGFPGAVLIRAVEPLHGVEIMRQRRGADINDRGTDIHETLGRGPGNLARALGVTGALDSHPLHRPPLIIAQGTRIDPQDVLVSSRVGITRAKDLPLRFYVRSSPSVSRGP